MINTNDLKMIHGSNYNGDDNWMFYINDEDVYFFIYENKVVAEAVLFNNHFSSPDYIRIYDFQVNPKLKRKGFGRATVNKIMEYALKNNKLGISGESTYDAYEFWLNLGAEFKEDNDDNNNIDEDDNYYGDKLIPFIIKPVAI